MENTSSWFNAHIKSKICKQSFYFIKQIPEFLLQKIKFYHVKQHRTLKNHTCNVKGKAIPLQAWTRPEGSKRLRLTRFQDNRHMKVVRLSALCTDCLYPPRKYSWYSFELEAESTPGP
jgi:uncharacterized protein (DUF2384 family)